MSSSCSSALAGSRSYALCCLSCLSRWLAPNANPAAADAMEIVVARISVSQIYSGCVKTREEGWMVARQESPTGREFCHELMVRWCGISASGIIEQHTTHDDLLTYSGSASYFPPNSRFGIPCVSPFYSRARARELANGTLTEV